MAQQFQHSAIQTVGGPTGMSEIVLHPPWEGEVAEAIFVMATATAGTGANIIYVSSDGGQILQGSTTLQGESRGFVVAINGIGSQALGGFPLRVTSDLHITPAPSGSGTIYISFFWRRARIAVADQVALPLAKDVETVEERRKRQEKIIWEQQKGLPPPKVYRDPEAPELTKRQREQLRRMRTLFKDNKEQSPLDL